jgi:hypothetical protein
MPKECQHVFCQVEREVFRCTNCGMMADMQTDHSLVARGQIKSVDITLNIGGVKAPDAKRVGDLASATFSEHVPLAYDTKKSHTVCEKCAAPIFRYGDTWWACYGDKQEDCVCPATPEQKSAPLAVVKAPQPDYYDAASEMLKHSSDYVDRMLVDIIKGCLHDKGVTIGKAAVASCAGCGLVVGTAMQGKGGARTSIVGVNIKADGFVYHDEALAYDAARMAAAAWLNHPLSVDPIASELSASISRRLLTPAPSPLPNHPPDYGVDMHPFLETPGTSLAIKRAMLQILPMGITFDEALAAMGYVPKDELTKKDIALGLSERQYEERDARLVVAERELMLRGDNLQIVNDEKRELEAENSRLRRKVERLERRK